MRILRLTVLAGLLACHDVQPSAPCEIDPTLAGTWAVAIRDAFHAGHVHLLTVQQSGCALMARFPASRTWENDPETDLSAIAGQFVTTDTGYVGAFGDAFQLTVALTGDSLRGTITREIDHQPRHWPVFGFRVDPAVLAQRDVADAPIPCETPIVLLRLDDAPTEDRRFVAEILRRGLTAEIAVPTRLIGNADRVTWAELHQWRDRGIGMAAHSRRHAANTTKDLDFLSEYVGSLNDMAQHGLATNIFVQPGPWHGAGDSLYFDTPGKLRNWRGSLARTVARVFEAYTYHVPTTCPIQAGYALGIAHNTVSDGRAASRVLQFWEHAQAPGRVTVFLVHTRTLSTPGQLDWFLDSLATASTQRRVRVVSSLSGAF